MKRCVLRCFFKKKSEEVVTHVGSKECPCVES